ncbi:hypothetical protein [Vibrio sagamiensis]|nr:hypothetical protein [Vibrio sagamiensis]
MSNTIKLMCATLLLSPISYAQEVNHSSVVQTAFYDQVDPKYTDSLYLFQLVMSKNCLTYQREEEACGVYLEEKRESVTSDWYQEIDPIKKQYLKIKLDMLENMRTVLADVHYGDQGYYSAIVADTQAIMDAKFEPQLQEIFSQELAKNSGRTGHDFVGSKQQLLFQYQNEAQYFRDTVIEPFEIGTPPATKKDKIYYQELLFSKQYLAEKVLMTSAERELDTYLKSVIRDLVRCSECTTTPIVKMWNNSSVHYKEISVTELMLFGLENDGWIGNTEILYPIEYFGIVEKEISVIQFLTYLRSYIQQNQDNFFVSQDQLLSGNKPGNVEQVSWEVMQKGVSNNNLSSDIWQKAIVPNIRDLFNSLVDITTESTGATFVNQASQAMNSAVTTSFKLAHIGKTFNIASAIETVVNHIPKVVIGEETRRACRNDSFTGSGGITLEENCIYVPNFGSGKFPITIGKLFDQKEGSAVIQDMTGGNTALMTLYRYIPTRILNPWDMFFDGVQFITGVDVRQYGQDIMGYNVSLIHKSGAIVFRDIIFGKEELVLQKANLLDTDVSHYTLKIYSNLNNNEVASFTLSNAMFYRSKGGVVHGNKFYFVEEIPYNQEPEYVNEVRASQKCPTPHPQVSDRKKYFFDCLEEKYNYSYIPDYYLDNMTVVSKPE